ncbi:MAG: methyltransferase [Oscillospiraceae bacterium]|nr:methyltransferase [Oscillospiraceae bacterium]
MNKKQLSQINFYMTGIAARAEENRDFFINITADFKSGTKTFQGTLTHTDGFVWEHNGVKKSIDAGEISSCIEEAAALYDSAEITYNERGTKIIVTANEKGVKMRREDNLTNPDEPVGPAVQSGRAYTVNPALAKDLLNELGILAKNGKIKNDKIRKYNQIDYFTELFGGILDEIYTPGQKKELIITDCACGKSYLSFVLNFYLTEIRRIKCRFIGIDHSQTVINASKRMAENLNYKNMEFIKADLTEYVPPARIDAVISLHACDTATDMAVALGIRAKAKAVICVPCCHKDILKQYSYEPFSAVIKHGILKARLADTLTDGLRSVYLESLGYKVSLIEYISPLETPKNIMIRAIFTGEENKTAADEYRKLKKMLNVTPAVEIYTELQRKTE